MADFFLPADRNRVSSGAQVCTFAEELTKSLAPLLFETEALGLDCTDTDIAAVFKDWEEWEKQRSDLETQARSLWLNSREEIETLLNKASDNRWLNGNQYRLATFSEKLAELAAWAQMDINLEIEVLAKFGQQKLQSGLVKAHQDKAGELQHGAFKAIDDLVSFTLQEIDIGEKLTLHAIHWIRHRYDTEKQRLARMTFDDMLTRLDKALHGDNGERLASVIRQQYPMALIDAVSGHRPRAIPDFCHPVSG